MQVFQLTSQLEALLNAPRQHARSLHAGGLPWQREGSGEEKYRGSGTELSQVVLHCTIQLCSRV